MRKPNKDKATPEKAVIPTQNSDPVSEIRAAWHSLYQLGDDALARSKEALERGDITAFFAAQESFKLTRNAIKTLRPVGDLAFHARKFKLGRKISTGGPIRKAIAKLLQKNRSFKNPDLWAALSAKAPKGWTFFDNAQGKYIEGPNFAEDHMVYRRFCTVCGEERKKLKL